MTGHFSGHDWLHRLTVTHIYLYQQNTNICYAIVLATSSLNWVKLDALKSMAKDPLSKPRQSSDLSASWPSVKPSSKQQKQLGYHSYNSWSGDRTNNVSGLASPPPVTRARPASTPIERTSTWSASSQHQQSRESNEEEFGLLALVNRLNSAASRNRRR